MACHKLTFIRQEVEAANVEARIWYKDFVRTKRREPTEGEFHILVEILLMLRVTTSPRELELREELVRFNGKSNGYLV